MIDAFNNIDFERALRSIGIQEDDLILLHSDLMTLGVPQGAKNRKDILLFYWKVFNKVLGAKGTLSVPAYYYEYARFGIPFDTEKSPVSKSLGAFSAFINTLPNRIRSANPLQSIASVGLKAKEISGGNSLSGYGVNSPWHRLRLHGGKIVFLGVDMQAMTYVHYLEQLVGVPHLYFKLFTNPVSRNGDVIPGFPVSAVRYLEFNIEYFLKPFEKMLLQKGLARQANIGQGSILSVLAEDAYQVGIECLEKDSYFFLKSAPKFIPGKIPEDGATGR